MKRSLIAAGILAMVGTMFAVAGIRSGVRGSTTGMMLKGPGTMPGSPNLGYVEKDIWMCTGDGWVDLGQGCPGQKARVWTKDTTYYHACNREEWCMGLNNEASVAQWMELHTYGDGWHWGVRKVGCYTANAFSFDARSNGPLVVSFEGFDNLTPCEGESVGGNSFLPVRYVFCDRGTECPPAENDESWYNALDLNQCRWYIPDSVMCNGGFCRDIWSSIQTDSCTPCANYHDCDGAEICLTLQCIQPWIDPETGDFARMPDFPLTPRKGNAAAGH